MKKSFQWAMVVVIAFGIAIAGCAQKPETANASQAISKAKAIESVEGKVQYLVKEANAFVSSQQFDEAANTAKYILKEVDQNSQEAKKVLEKAQAGLKKMADEKMAEAKNALKDFGK